MAKKESPNYSFLNLDHETETIRCVEPYVFDYTTFAKGRWLKRPLIDVLTKEFGGYEPSYWHNAISSGRVTVNRQATAPDYLIQNSDRIVHRTHRHEPPVKGCIDLVGETDDLLAVCKPASMPMHPWYC
jgi:23S rRNA-/tRNA-specific pseudouridylate synthase